MVLTKSSARERLRGVVVGIRDALLPSRPLPEPQEPPVEDADVRAAGHRHLGPPPEEVPPAGGRQPGRPWTRKLHRWGEVHHKARG